MTGKEYNYVYARYSTNDGVTSFDHSTDDYTN
jgi:hypothetical protein